MLKTIGKEAFYNCNLTYQYKISPLVIPSGVTAIGMTAFSSNNVTNTPNLDYIKFKGTLTLGNTDWYNSNYTTLYS